MKKTLLIIDLQKEFKDEHGQYEKVMTFIKEHANEYDDIIGTVLEKSTINIAEQDNEYITNNFILGMKKEEQVEYLEEIKDVSHCMLFRSGYSPAHIGFLLNQEMQIDMIGCDTKSGIMATCLLLQADGLHFRVLADYVYTTAKNTTKGDLLKQLRNLFENAVVEENTMPLDISQYRKYHCESVAEYMLQNAMKYGLNGKEMYMIGILHDTGRRFDNQHHEVVGADILMAGNYKYADIIRYHGYTPEQYMLETGKEVPKELMLLWEADMSVNYAGHVVGFDGRLQDIKNRYGDNSKAVQHVIAIEEFLRAH